MRLSLIILLLASFHAVNSYKILVYNSKFGHSHTNYLGQIADILVEAGHNVTSLLPIMDAEVRDSTEKSVKIHVEPDQEVADMYKDLSKNTVNFFEMNTANPIIPLIVGPMFGDLFYRNCKKVLEEPGIIERLRDEKFDVMIGENFDVCGIGMSEFIAPKAMIGISTTCLFGWQFDEFGIPAALSYRATGLTPNFDVHSFFSRLYNVYGEVLGRAMFWFSRRSINRALKEKFGPDYPSVAELSSKVAYVFANSEPLIEAAEPTMSRVINLGGIGAKQPKKLDEYWEGVINLRSKTVLLSFGSMAKSILLPQESKMGILRTIARFPDVTFIWKYEDLEDEFVKEHASKLPHLVMTKWMPQVDILGHPKLSAFITHGGMGSTQETALRGVPGIFIPLFAEQPRNAGMMQFNGFGKVYSKWELANDEKLAATIREVLENEQYRMNAKRISAMLAKKPFSSRELLIKHVEFAAEFGPSAALRPQSVDMNIIEYHNLDVIAFIVVVSSIFLYVSTKILLCVLRRFVRVAKPKTD